MLSRKLLLGAILTLMTTGLAANQEAGYVPNPYVRSITWSMVMPYFLPEDHPVKEKLDEIFSRSRVTESPRAMKKAGFTNYKPRKWTHLIVTKHPKIEGYVLKVYTDAQRHSKEMHEYDLWIQRIEGVRAIQKLIDENNWNHLFKTPKKWIYPLPVEPSPPSGFHRKNFILIEEDMDLFADKANKKMWKSDAVTPDLIHALYTILEEIGLKDCAKPDNIPFSHDGKIAFIDTQTTKSWPVNYKKLNSSLTHRMKKEWKKMTKKSKKKSKKS